MGVRPVHNQRGVYNMFGRNKGEETDRQVSEANASDRAHALRKDPSSIKGMTQAELNKVIDSGKISRDTLRRIL